MSGVTITMEMNLKPEVADQFCSSLPEMIKETVARPGFIGIDIVRNKDDRARLLFVERWETEQAYHDYVAWRTERGDMAAMADLLAEAPKLAVWPTTVAHG